MSPEFQKFRGRFKTTREDRKLRLKFQIASGKSDFPPEIGNYDGTIESSAGKLNLSLKLGNFCGKFKFPADGEHLQLKVNISS